MGVTYANVYEGLYPVIDTDHNPLRPEEKAALGINPLRPEETASLG